MRNKKMMSLFLSISTILSSQFFINSVKAEGIDYTAAISKENAAQSPQVTAVLDSKGNLKPVRLKMAKTRAIPGVYLSPSTISTSPLVTTAAYTAPYSIIYTPLGQAEFLQQGCTDADYRANGWVSMLQEDLNSLSRSYPGLNISLTTDGIYGPATTTAVRTFQSYIKYTWGCSTMSIDGAAGYQTWTAIFALYNGYNPHNYIS